MSGAGAYGPFLGALLKDLLPTGTMTVLGLSVDPLQIMFGVAAALCVVPVAVSRLLLE